VWLIEEAVWEDRKRDIGGKTVTLKRGQVGHSLRFMAEAWGWSKSGVERFIERLKTETMIETATGTGMVIITICNYDRYQAMPGFGGTASGTGSGQHRDSTETNLNQVNKGNQVIEEGSPSDSPTPAPETADVGVEIGCFTEGIAPNPGSLLPTADILTMPKREAETALEG
jgi:DNA-binding transcriptional MocR family regulator